MSAAAHIAKARRALASARHQLAGDFVEQAGRDAYLAGFHAALGLIFARTGKSPKTHSGTRSEFARLARDEGGISREQVAFLGWAYELKTVADYGSEPQVSSAQAERAIAEAECFVETVAERLNLD